MAEQYEKKEIARKSLVAWMELPNVRFPSELNDLLKGVHKHGLHSTLVVYREIC